MKRTIIASLFIALFALSAYGANAQSCQQVYTCQQIFDQSGGNYCPDSECLLTSGSTCSNRYSCSNFTSQSTCNPLITCEYMSAPSGSSGNNTSSTGNSVGSLESATCSSASGWSYDPTYVPPPVYGCTSSTATNYNPSATSDDGSCTFPQTACVSRYRWVNINAGTVNPTQGCAAVGAVPVPVASSPAERGICASGENRPTSGYDVMNINYSRGIWGGGNGGGGTDVPWQNGGYRCYEPGQAWDRDNTDVAVAYYCDFGSQYSTSCPADYPSSTGGSQYKKAIDAPVYNPYELYFVPKYLFASLVDFFRPLSVIAASSDSNSVRIYEGPMGSGRLLATVPANQYRADVNAVMGISGNHGFTWAVPESLRDNSPHTLYFYGTNVDGTGQDSQLGNSPATIQCAPTNSAPSSPSLSCPANGSYVNQSLQVSFVSSDGNGDSVRYLIDWDANGSTDQIVPSGGSFAASGSQQSASRSWSTTGSKTVRVATEDSRGAVSGAASCSFSLVAQPPTTCQDPLANNFGGALPCTYNPISPLVSITSPANNSQFQNGSNVSIAASASDADGSVSNVRFLVDNTTISTDSVAPYAANWTASPAGIYTLKAVATDNAGLTSENSVKVISEAGTVCRDSTASNYLSPLPCSWPPQACSDSRAVNYGGLLPCRYPPGSCNDPSAYNFGGALPCTYNTNPSVSITSPANNSQFQTGSSVSAAATASDIDGTVSKVQFFIDGTSIGTDTTSPYTASWTASPAGIYTLKAVATDNAGLTSENSVKVISEAGTVCRDSTANNYLSPLPCSWPPQACSDSRAVNYGGLLPCRYPPGSCNDPSAYNFGGALPCTYNPPAEFDVTIRSSNDSVTLSSPSDTYQITIYSEANVPTGTTLTQHGLEYRLNGGAWRNAGAWNDLVPNQERQTDSSFQETVISQAGTHEFRVYGSNNGGATYDYTSPVAITATENTSCLNPESVSCDTFCDLNPDNFVCTNGGGGGNGPGSVNFCTNNPSHESCGPGSQYCLSIPGAPSCSGFTVTSNESNIVPIQFLGSLTATSSLPATSSPRRIEVNQVSGFSDPVRLEVTDIRSRSGGNPLPENVSVSYNFDNSGPTATLTWNESFGRYVTPYGIGSVFQASFSRAIFEAYNITIRGISVNNPSKTSDFVLTIDPSAINPQFREI